ncbi:MAG: LapA family protein [Rubrivivax sp.]|nr:LapA family protein [Rubrivivax sp.]
MRYLLGLFRAFVFFTLFAFALNNQQTAVVHWFFGVEWRTPMVMVVLTAFAAGCAIGALAMVPSWWRQRRVARRHAPPPPPVVAAAVSGSVTPSEFGPEHPPREGL